MLSYTYKAYLSKMNMEMLYVSPLLDSEAHADLYAHPWCFGARR
jgi:hypothetical protein